ncbi:exported hypothetical protein [uncultured Desulfatiglans sp.]|nr:exported hypothetical protein [uncultured Desulfatiglans sp.]
MRRIRLAVLQPLKKLASVPVAVNQNIPSRPLGVAACEPR